jgi:cytochrome c biogenesis protein CcmG/thiol:disulfide interchange protein DsbE
MQPTKIDRYIRIAICALTVALVFAIYSGIHEHVVIAGDTAPSFTITADNGSVVTLPQSWPWAPGNFAQGKFSGKLLVLNFWASWCPPCVQETPSLSRLASQFASKGVVVLAVSVDHDPKAYNAFLQKFQPAFLTVRDLTLHEKYGTYMYPETYIISPDGKVLQKFAEGEDWSDPKITQYIESLL